MVKTEIECSNCGENIILVTRDDSMVNFCPNCGTSQDVADGIYNDEEVE